MLLTSYSGPRGRHLQELVDVGHIGLCELFQYSACFPADAFKRKTTLKSFLDTHSTLSHFYSGIHFITCADIKREEELRKVIKKFVDESYADGSFANFTPEQKQKAIQEHVKGKQGFEWARKPHKKTFFDWVMWKRAYVIVAVLALILDLIVILASADSSIIGAIAKFLLIGLAIIAVFLAIFIPVSIRRMESVNHDVAKKLSHDELRKLSYTQKNPIVNELTAVGITKKGSFRRWIFRTIIRVISYSSGLSDIPTIVNARWIAAQKGKLLVFISNYSNMADTYVRDFIDSKASARGINLLFGHGDGFPQTKWLLREGALKNPEGFMNVFFRSQRITQFWYWPYPGLSVDNIKNNREIRNGLFRKISTDEIKKWLNRV
jgi:hypothetical protein